MNPRLTRVCAFLETPPGVNPKMCVCVCIYIYIYITI